MVPTSMSPPTAAPGPSLAHWWWRTLSCNSSNSSSGPRSRWSALDILPFATHSSLDRLHAAPRMSLHWLDLRVDSYCQFETVHCPCGGTCQWCSLLVTHCERVDNREPIIDTPVHKYPGPGRKYVPLLPGRVRSHQVLKLVNLIILKF